MISPNPRMLALGLVLALPIARLAAGPTVKQGLELRPIQRDVEYDQPSVNEVKGCTIKSEKLVEGTGWVVRGAANQMLRCFADSNGDNKVDQWRYYYNGIESYRDIDSNFNGKADQYRWLGLSGSRWGMDRNEDGKIDAWISISAEEVSAEIVEALRTRDVERFTRVVLTTDELQHLGIGGYRQERIEKSLATAAMRFEKAARAQRQVTADSRWMHFGAMRPGVMPAGTDGSKNDVMVYENVLAMIETGGKAGQLPIGTMVKVGNKWRVLDIPVGLMDEEAGMEASAYVLQAITSPPPRVGELPEQNPTAAKMQELASKMQEIETSLSTATSAEERTVLFERQARILRSMADLAPNAEEKETWLTQLADTLSTGIQTGSYPGGMALLKKLFADLKKVAPKSNLTAHTAFQIVTAEYTLGLTADDAQPQKVQEKWEAALERLVEEYPTSGVASEAMLQLAITAEFSGDDDASKRWYTGIVKAATKPLLVEKARGALRRFDSVGQTIEVKGQTLQGKAISTTQQQFRGRLVLVHYWATWCEPCKQEMAVISLLFKKYRDRGFIPVGVTLDDQPQAAIEYLRSSKLEQWPMLFDRGGLDGRLALEMGIVTVPTMFLIDPKGKVIDRNVQINELEALIEKTLEN